MQPLPIIQNSKKWYLLSIILIIPGIISLMVWGLNIGIDFRGGTQLQISYPQNRPDVHQIREKLSSANIPGTTIQTSGNTDIIVRFPNTNDRVARTDANTILAKLGEDNAQPQEKAYESIGGAVATSTTKNAVTAVVVASIALILFIAWSFRGVPKPASSWRFGVSAIVALLHDLLFVVGAFSLIGHFFHSVEVDALFITALLTILGFSVNDTIVVFDRIRENLRRNPGKTFADIANESLNQTLARSLNTSLTVLIVLVSLLLLGGESVRSFILALTLGVAIGTYSSIFNAAPLLVSWQKWVDKKNQPA